MPGPGDQAENEANPTPTLTGVIIVRWRETRKQVVIIQPDKSYSERNARVWRNLEEGIPVELGNQGKTRVADAWLEP